MDIELPDYVYKIQAVNRARKIPSVNYLWDKSMEVYGRVKETNVFIHWAFNTMENVLNTVMEKSLPVAKLMEKPIYTLDKTFCQGLDYVEVKLPIIKEEPEQIINRTKSIVSKSLEPAVKTFIELKQETEHKVRIMTLLTYYKVYYLRIYSWQQADRVMSTEIGISILKTVDNTTDFVELLLDKYLPVPYHEFHTSTTEKLCNEDGKFHHTVKRLSEFSSRASRHIYFALVDRWQHLYNIEILVLILYTLIVIQTIKLSETTLSFISKLLNNCLVTH
nr:PREDICTED: lipid storage droplets surface-binding protein 2-like [Megachile rotundata]